MEDLEKIVGKEFDAIAKAIKDVDLNKAGIALGGIVQEFSTLLETGALTRPIKHTVTMGGGIVQELSSEVIKFYKTMFVTMAQLGQSIDMIMNDDANDAIMELISDEWKSAFRSHPITSLKLRKHVKNFEKSFKSFDPTKTKSAKKAAKKEKHATAVELFTELKTDGGSLDDLTVENGQLVIDFGVGKGAVKRVVKKAAAKRVVKKAAPKKNIKQ